MDSTHQPASPASGQPAASNSDVQDLTKQVASSYVDDYLPPVQAPPAPTLPAESTQTQKTPVLPPASTTGSTPASVSTPAVSAMPPAAPAIAPASPAAAPQNTDSAPAKKGQTLEDQNIFHMLGIDSVKEEEKEAFLDELQQIIWEDFLDHDVELLITEEEMVDFKKIVEKPGMSEDDRQSEMVEFLEKLIPDLEKIMLEKALELKEEMFRERISDLKTQYAGKPEMLSQVEKAASLMEGQQWLSAADALNTVGK